MFRLVLLPPFCNGDDVVKLKTVVASALDALTTITLPNE